MDQNVQYLDFLVSGQTGASGSGQTGTSGQTGIARQTGVSRYTDCRINNNQDLKSFDLYGLFKKILWWWWVVFCFVLVVLPIAHPHQQVAHTSTININHTAKLFQKSDVTQNLSTIF